MDGMDYGLWTMDYGLWTMDYMDGMDSMDYGRYGHLSYYYLVIHKLRNRSFTLLKAPGFCYYQCTFVSLKAISETGDRGPA